MNWEITAGALSNGEALLHRHGCFAAEGDLLLLLVVVGGAVVNKGHCVRCQVNATQGLSKVVCFLGKVVLGKRSEGRRDLTFAHCIQHHTIFAVGSDVAASPFLPVCSVSGTRG